MLYLYIAVEKEGNTVAFLLIKRQQHMSTQIFLIKVIGNNGNPKLIHIDKIGSNISDIKFIINLVTHE